MGGTRSSSVDWSSYSRSSQTQSQSFQQAFTNTSGVKADFKPTTGMIRESRNSVANPESTPVIIGLDCTGSMHRIALAAKKSFGTFMAEVYDRKPVTDPHVLVAFNDDVRAGSGPQALQVTQFEADKVILDQMEQLYWVNDGGGNGSESYNLVLHFAINHTDCDAFKDGRKGFIFMMGDDGPPPALTTHDLQTVYGPDYPIIEPLDMKTLVEQAEENWHVFFIVPPGSPHHIVAQWRQLLGERVIVLEDIDKMAEVLVALMQVIAGADKAAVAASFKDPGTSLVVASAIKDLTPAGRSGGVVRV